MLPGLGHGIIETPQPIQVVLQNALSKNTCLYVTHPSLFVRGFPCRQATSTPWVGDDYNLTMIGDSFPVYAWEIQQNGTNYFMASNSTDGSPVFVAALPGPIPVYAWKYIHSNYHSQQERAFRFISGPGPNLELCLTLANSAQASSASSDGIAVTVSHCTIQESGTDNIMTATHQDWIMLEYSQLNV